MKRIKRDDTEHGFEYYWADEVDALLAQQEPVAWGVDWGRAGDQSCVSIIKRLPGGGIEVLATEYGPPASKPWVGLTDEERNAIGRHHAYVDNIIRATEAKLREKNA